jgi:serine protease Do
MHRGFTVVTFCLSVTVAFIVGLVVAGSLTPTPAVSSSMDRPAPRLRPVTTGGDPARAASLVNFADVAERINPAVVNIDATSRGRGDGSRSDRRRGPTGRDLFDDPFDFSQRGERDAPRKGAGSGFIIDRDGFILTNHHVVDRAERITVKLSDGRSLRAHVVGTDPDTDIALIKVESTEALPVAPLGDSTHLRVGEWVCAIGNPLAYEHTVTVGVVSFIGRKLFDNSLDNYIQTDAAINFGNSGGPLINAAGEVIGINAAISSRASNIGFAVPINQASAILPQLKSRGRVSRGYIGIALKDVDPDLQRSLNLGVAHGALVQDVTAGSPGERAGLRPYDLILSVDGQAVSSNDELIREISARQPGSLARVQFLRDGRQTTITVKLAERPGRERSTDRPQDDAGNSSPAPPARPLDDLTPLGLTVRDLDREFAQRYAIPDDASGVIVSRVEPMSDAFDAGLERGWIILEIGRQPVRTVADFKRIVRTARSGDVLAVLVYRPDIEQRALQTIRVDGQ